MKLSKREARSLAWRVLIRHMNDNSEWLHWDDYPNLDEATFILMGDMLRGEMADTMSHVNAMYDKQWHVDAAALEEKARR